MIEKLTENGFQEATNKEKPVIVDFWAEWCAPCKALAPVLEELSNEIKEVDFYKFDVDSAQEFSGKLGIMSIPTIIVFKKGEEIARVTGFSNKEVLKQSLLSKIQ